MSWTLACLTFVETPGSKTNFILTGMPSKKPPFNIHQGTDGLFIKPAYLLATNHGAVTKLKR